MKRNVLRSNNKSHHHWTINEKRRRQGREKIAAWATRCAKRRSEDDNEADRVETYTRNRTHEYTQLTNEANKRIIAQRRITTTRYTPYTELNYNTIFFSFFCIANLQGAKPPCNINWLIFISFHCKLRGAKPPCNIK